MESYYEHNGILLDAYEWARGMGLEEKSVARAQASRRREVKKGAAKIIEEKND